MAEQNHSETHGSLSRLEAFSDGVIAIIITIMVLELHAPHEEGWAPLIALWPVLSAYLLSFVYVAIYWLNHHRLLAHARRITNRMLWINMALLFTLSLIPFTTAYLGTHHFNRDATLLYMAIMLATAISYRHLQNDIRRHGDQSPAAQAYHHAMDRKATVSVALYLSGFALAFWSPALGIACAGAVALLWFMPASPLDRFFSACGLR